MKRITDLPLHGAAIYNPDLLSKAELIEQFVARRALLDRLVDDLARDGGSQHYLLLGQRGMGKTTLLRRLGYAIEDDPRLRASWLPLTFPEEQYNVARLSDLYTNCIDALCDYLERQGHDEHAHRLDEQIARLPRSDETRTNAALTLLLGEADKRDKGLVLLIDNIDVVLGRLSTQEQWALREVLSKRDKLLIVGASASALEAHFKYQAPFYEFFLTHELRGLDLPQTREVILCLAESGQAPHVRRIVETEPERLRTIHILSGGNPRTTALLYTVLASERVGSVRTDLEQLLDQCTPLYKARFEELSAQAQQIIHALAVRWDPCLARDIAEDTQLDVKTVSSQLNRLVKQGLVQKVPYPPSPKHGFQIAERFFNIWYLMRTSRRVRRRLLWLVEFLKLAVGPARIESEARAYLREFATAPMRQKHTELGLALAQVVQQKSLRDALNHKALHELIEDRRLWSRFRRFFDFESADADLEPLVARQEKLAELRTLIRSAHVPTSDWEAEHFELLFLAIPGAPTAKLALARAILAHPERYLAIAIRIFQLVHDGQAALLGDCPTVENLRRAFQEGHMVDMDDADGIRSAAEAYDDPELARIASLAGLTSPAEFVAAIEGTTVPGLALLGAALQTFANNEHELALEQVQQILAQKPSFWLASLCAGLFRLKTGSAGESYQHLTPTAATSRFGASILCLTRMFLLQDIGDWNAFDQECLHFAQLNANSIWADIAHLVHDLRPLADRDDEASQTRARAIVVQQFPGIRSAIDWQNIVDTILSACSYYLLSLNTKRREHPREYDESIFLVRTAVSETPSILETLRAKDMEVKHPTVLRAVLGSNLTELAAAIENAISEYDKRHNPKPMTTGDWLQRALLRYEPCAQLGLAENAYREALGLEPDNAAVRRCLGSLLTSFENRLEEAHTLYDEGLELTPEAALLWQGKAELYEIQGHDERALHALERALEQSEKPADLLHSKASLLAENLHRYEEALAVYEELLAGEPNNDEFLLAKGELLAKQLDRPLEALACYEQILNRDNSHADAWCHKGYTYAFYVENGRDDALSCLRRAIACDAEHADSWMYLALILACRDEDLSDAENACRQAVRLAPDQPLAWQTLADVQLRLGRAEQEAEDAARRALELAPEWRAAQLTLAAVLMARGNWLEALVAAKQTLQTADNPDESLPDDSWPDGSWHLILLFSQQAVRVERARELAEMLADIGLAGPWQPLHEALLASAEGSAERLQRIAPEIRAPAQELLDELTGFTPGE